LAGIHLEKVLAGLFIEDAELYVSMVTALHKVSDVS
jgi:hypothetical protein